MGFKRFPQRTVSRLAFCFIGLARVGIFLAIQGVVVQGFASQVSAAELSEIRQRGYLIVGVKDNLFPLGFLGEQGELQGLEIDLARWLADRLLGDSEAIVFQPLSNRERLSALLQDEVDLVIAQLSVTVSRSRVVDFSTPYFLDGTAFVTPLGTVQSLGDLSQATIAVLSNSYTIATVRSTLPDARLVGVESYQQAKTLLDTGEAAAFAGDVSVLSGWVQHYPQYHLLPTLLSAEALAVALPKGLQYEELRQQTNQAIEAWQSEGILRERVEAWGLPEAGIPGQFGL